MHNHVQRALKIARDTFSYDATYKGNTIKVQPYTREKELVTSDTIRAIKYFMVLITDVPDIDTGSVIVYDSKDWTVQDISSDHPNYYNLQVRSDERLNF